MDVIDRLNSAMRRLKQLGIEVRFEHLDGVPSGLCSLEDKSVLMVEVSLRSIEQLELFEQVIKQVHAKSNAAA